MDSQKKTYSILPDFKIDPVKIPSAKIKSIRFQNFKIFEDYTFDFTEHDKSKPFICFVGPNGFGKTTILDSIQIFFSRYEGREETHLKALLGKSVRHVNGKTDAGIYGDADFLITAKIETSLPIGEYEIQLNKSGFVKNHPEEVKEILSRLCFYAGFDRELHNFQIPRSKWTVFKDLYESITGFTISETGTLFDDSKDPVQSDLMKKYIMAFQVHKKDEIIGHKECSAGERKIIKCFSTLLSKEYTPSIILIDNIAMHIEEGRHINLIDAMRRSFPNSQIFAAAHSYQISRNYRDKKYLYDLRIVKASDIVRAEPWRLVLSDEIRDAISKLRSTNPFSINGRHINGSMVDPNLMDLERIAKQGEHLLQACMEKKLIEITEMKEFIHKANHFYIANIMAYYDKKD